MMSGVGLATESRQRIWRHVVFGANPELTLARVLVWTALSLLLFHRLLLPIRVVGSSMSPTYENGSVNFVNTTAYMRASPKRGDVVVLKYEGEILLKRVVAVPGENVSISGGTIRVNSEPVHDRFASARISEEMETSS